MPTGRIPPRMFVLSLLFFACEGAAGRGAEEATDGGPALDARPESGDPPADGAAPDADPESGDTAADANPVSVDPAVDANPGSDDAAPDAVSRSDDAAPDAGPVSDGSPPDAEGLPEAPELPPLAGAGLPACRRPPEVPVYPSFPPPGPFVPPSCPAWGEAPDDAGFRQGDVTLELGTPATDGLAFRAGGRTIVVWWGDGDDGFFGIMDGAGAAFAATGVLVGLNSWPGDRVGKRVAPTCDGFVALTYTRLPVEDWSLKRIDLDGREAATRPRIAARSDYGSPGSDISLAAADEGIVFLEHYFHPVLVDFTDIRRVSLLDPETLETTREGQEVMIHEADLLAVGRLDGQTQVLYEGGGGRQKVWSLPLDLLAVDVPEFPNAPDPRADAASSGNDGLYLASMGPGEILFTHLGSGGLLAQRTVRAATDQPVGRPRQVLATETGAVVVAGNFLGPLRLLDLDDAGHRRAPDRLVDGPVDGPADRAVSVFLTPAGPAAAVFQGDRVRLAPASAIFSSVDAESPCSRQAPGECGLGSWAVPDEGEAGGEDGGWRCVTPEAAPEVCNGRDDDCDGGADETLADCPIAYAGPRVGPPPPVACALLSDFLWPWQLWRDSPVPDPCAQTASDAPCAIEDWLGWHAILRDDAGRVLEQDGTAYRWDPVDGSFQGTTDEPDSVYEYDEAGRLASIRNGQGEPLETFEYEPGGRLTRWWWRDRRGEGQTVNYLWSDDGEELIAWPMPFATATTFVGRFRLVSGLIVQGESHDPNRTFSRISFALRASPGQDWKTMSSYSANDDDVVVGATVVSRELTIETDHAGRHLQTYGTSRYQRSARGDPCEWECSGTTDTRYRYDERGRLAEIQTDGGGTRLAYDCAAGLPE